MAKTRQPLEPSPLPPPVEPGIVRRAANASLGGIAAFGNFLDLPASSVRDALALRNPFDQYLTPFSPDNRTTEGDLLRKAGLIGDEDTWSNLPARLAVGIATDPMSYLSLGTIAGLKKGGQALKKTGMLKHVEDVASARRALTGHTLKDGVTDAVRTATDILHADPHAPALNVAGNPILDEAGRAVSVAEHMKSKGLPLSGYANPKVGRREALTKTTLNQFIEALPTRSGATTLPLRDEVLKQLGEYTQKAHKMDLDTFLSKHGDEALAGHGSYGLPFTNGTVFSLGDKMDRVNKYLDIAGAYVKHSAPARAAAMLFDPEVMGRFKAEEQSLARRAYHRVKSAKAQAAATAFGISKQLDDLAGQFETHFKGTNLKSPIDGSSLGEIKSTRDAIARILRFSSEHTQMTGAGPVDKAQYALLSMAPDAITAMPTGDSLRLSEEINKLTATIQKAKNDLHADLSASGLDVGTVGNDIFTHFPRFAQPKTFDEYQKYAHAMAPTSGIATASRTPEISHLPAEAVEWLVDHPQLRQMKPQQAAAEIQKHLGQWLDASNNTLPQGAKPLTADDVAAWMNTTSKEFADPKSARRMYPNNPIEDFSVHLHSAARLKATKDALFHTLMAEVENAKHLPPGTRTVSMEELLGDLKGPGVQYRGIGLDHEKALDYMAQMAGNAAASREHDAFKNVLRHVAVPIETADAVRSIVTKTMGEPVWMNAATFWLDKMTNTLKTSLTVPWPAFTVRNLMSGQFWNLISDAVNTPSDVAQYARHFAKTRDMLRNPDQYADLLEEIATYDVFRYGYNAADLAGNTHVSGAVLPPPIHDVRGAFETAKQTVADRGQTSIEHWLRGSPRAQEAAGKVLGPARVALETPVEIGKRAAATGEWYNRVTMYSYLREKGWTAEAAAQKVKELQVDYGDLTDFEKSAARRVVPFYSYTRKMMSQLFEQLADNPGGPGGAAGMIKSINRMRTPGELLPDYVAETASIPVGTTEDGSRNYITGFGIPFEDPLSFFGNGVRGAGMELLSRLNPIAKAPLEYATGELFFQAGPQGGRDLPDADPLLGRTMANVVGRKDPFHVPELVEVALANSPASRLLSTTRQAFDPRKSLVTKALNLGTGVRVATISEGASDAILREAVQQELRDVGSRQFVQAYIPEDRKASMTPQQLEHATRLEGAMNALAARAKRRKLIKDREEAAAR